MKELVFVAFIPIVFLVGLLLVIRDANKKTKLRHNEVNRMSTRCNFFVEVMNGVFDFKDIVEHCEKCDYCYDLMHTKRNIKTWKRMVKRAKKEKFNV